MTHLLVRLDLGPEVLPPLSSRAGEVSRATAGDLRHSGAMRRLSR
ncbi:hypothetical protein [Ornithinimicrobium tianjinense]|nr:hypothetical protein [Ornithinimicrobium tianjinense]